MPEEDRKQIESKIESLRKSMEGDDLSEIKRLTEEVQQASYALSQQVAAQQGASDGGPEPSGESEGEAEGDVVEGEFREA